MQDQALFFDRLKLHVEIEKWPLKAPFSITGKTFTDGEFVLVTLEQDGKVGRGEAAGAYYKNETAEGMFIQIQGLRTLIEAGISRSSIQYTLPPCGARNALDCALWDLEAKLVGRPVWQIAGLSEPRPLMTTFTCGAASPEKMAAMALSYKGARAIKLKLTGSPEDAGRVMAVREARPDVWLAVDANQGFTRPQLELLIPSLVESRVELIEQPFPIGQESLLDGFQSPIALAADESVQNLSHMSTLPGRFNVVNIKLDKCGGLSEALLMARAAQHLGLDAMVGNMLGTSLAMAPAFLVGQMCKVVDLDGPVFLAEDRANPVQYKDGMITCPDVLWGSGARE
jgi:L-alanine-DL-glutamate epimerase-like enolase superfamily enzyme